MNWDSPIAFTSRMKLRGEIGSERQSFYILKGKTYFESNIELFFKSSIRLKM